MKIKIILCLIALSHTKSEKHMQTAEVAKPLQRQRHAEKDKKETLWPIVVPFLIIVAIGGSGATCCIMQDRKLIAEHKSGGLQMSKEEEAVRDLYFIHYTNQDWRKPESKESVKKCMELRGCRNGFVADDVYAVLYRILGNEIEDYYKDPQKCQKTVKDEFGIRDKHIEEMLEHDGFKNRDLDFKKTTVLKRISNYLNIKFDKYSDALSKARK